MGTEVNAQKDGNSEYVRSVRELGRIIVDRTVSLKFFDLFYRFTEDYHIEKHCLKVLHGYTTNVIRKKKQEIERNNCNESVLNEKIEEHGRKAKKAFLDLLIHESLASDKPLTDEELREEVDTFMFEVRKSMHTECPTN